MPGYAEGEVNHIYIYIYIYIYFFFIHHTQRLNIEGVFEQTCVDKTPDPNR
jgi:hypothetical protein